MPPIYRSLQYMNRLNRSLNTAHNRISITASSAGSINYIFTVLDKINYIILDVVGSSRQLKWVTVCQTFVCQCWGGMRGISQENTWFAKFHQVLTIETNSSQHSNLFCPGLYTDVCVPGESHVLCQLYWLQYLAKVTQDTGLQYYTYVRMYQTHNSAYAHQRII